MKKNIVIYTFILGSVLVWGNMVGKAHIPYLTPQREPGLRNSFFRRGWPEFTQQVPDPQNTCIIVSNSQGFGREIVAERAYPAQLDTLAKNSETAPFRVANWSAPGAISHDLLLLSAQALQHKPKHLVIITYSQNFATHLIAKPLEFSKMDIPLLYSERAIRSRLPQRFHENYISSEYALLASCLRRFPLFRMRLHIKDEVEKKLKGKESYWWDASLTERSPQKKGVTLLAAEPRYFSYFDVLFQNAEETNIVIVLMPLAKDLLSEQAISVTEKFNAALVHHYNNSSISVWDMSWSMDTQEFYSFTHMREKNHAAFARLLFLKIETTAKRDSL